MTRVSIRRKQKAVARIARQSNARLLLTFLALFAFTCQSYLSQTHIHLWLSSGTDTQLTADSASKSLGGSTLPKDKYPADQDPALPGDTRWQPVDQLPEMAFDHGPMMTHAHSRLVAKMSYTNIGFALAPKEFALSTLRDIYGAALGYQVDATNLQRVLARRNVITRTGTIARSGRSGGRPAALYQFTDDQYRVTDEFAALRPPG